MGTALEAAAVARSSASPASFLVGSVVGDGLMLPLPCLGEDFGTSSPFCSCVDSLDSSSEIFGLAEAAALLTKEVTEAGVRTDGVDEDEDEGAEETLAAVEG